MTPSRNQSGQADEIGVIQIYFPFQKEEKRDPFASDISTLQEQSLKIFHFPQPCTAFVHF